MRTNIALEVDGERCRYPRIHVVAPADVGFLPGGAPVPARTDCPPAQGNTCFSTVNRAADASATP